jgi:hypothetical protein
VNWQNYIMRRRINVDQWLIREGISSREDFLSKLKSLSVEPPDEASISSMFPEKQKESIVEDEPKSADTAQGIDTASTRSVASQAGEASLRPGGVDAAKLRSRGNKSVR